MAVRQTARRRAALVVESAIIYPTVFLMLVGMVIGGLGVFRYQEVAALAREGARWASVRGGQYQKETGNPAASAQDVFDNAILANAVGLETTALSCTVTWSQDNWPNRVTTDYGRAETNTVTVTVTYQWIPEAYLGGITLTSSCVVPMTY